MGQGLGYWTAILRNLSSLSLVPDHNPALPAVSYAEAAHAELRITIRREQPNANLPDALDRPPARLGRR